MPYIPHTEDEVAAMLAAIGAASIDELFDEIPPELLIRELDGVPEALSELEISRLMLELARARFDNYIKLGLVEIREHDLRTGYPAVLACVTNCVLTLQFTPIEYRQRILSDIYETTMPSSPNEASALLTTSWKPCSVHGFGRM